MTFLEVAAVALIVLAIGPWWVLILLLRMLKREPHLLVTQDKVQQFGVLALVGTGAALVAANYELLHIFGHALYPPGFITVILVAVLLGVNVPAVIFLVNWYRH